MCDKLNETHRKGLKECYFRNIYDYHWCACLVVVFFLCLMPWRLMYDCMQTKLCYFIYTNNLTFICFGSFIVIVACICYLLLLLNLIITKIYFFLEKLYGCDLQSCFLMLFIYLVIRLFLNWFIAAIGVDEKKNVVITISSDKGLCGGNNSTSVKTSRAIRKISDGNCYFRAVIL